MRLPLITGWLTICHMHSLSLNAQMHKASISINRTQCVSVHVYVYAHTLKCIVSDRHLSHSITQLLLQTQGVKSDRRVWQMTTALFGWEMSRLWPSECPSHADISCGVRDVTNGERHGVEPETSTGKWPTHFPITLTVKKLKNWQSEGLPSKAF